MCCQKPDQTQAANMLMGQCVVVQLHDGARITGFANALVNGTLVLTVSGQPVSVPVIRIQRITKATGFAC